MFEILDVPEAGYIYTFTINPGARRGDHYHEQKREWFTCVAGRVTILLETPEGKKERIILDAEHPRIVYNAPGVAHAFLNETATPAVMVAYGFPRHDPSNPDTVKKFVE